MTLHEAQVGKVSLSDEITMLERLWASLRSVKEQASFIADSTGDQETRDRLDWVKAHAKTQADGVELLYLRAKNQLQENHEGAARDELAALSKELGRE